jgi:hypothetical protein
MKVYIVYRIIYLVFVIARCGGKFDDHALREETISINIHNSIY